MGMAHPTGGWTAEMVRALPDDGKRYEVIDGELFMTPGPSWRHGDAVLALVRRLDPYLQEYRLGHLKIAPQDVEFDPRNMVEPDLFVVPLVDGRRPLRWEDVRRLLLAIEILSPTPPGPTGSGSGPCTRESRCPNTGSWIPMLGWSSAGGQATSGPRSSILNLNASRIRLPHR